MKNYAMGWGKIGVMRIHTSIYAYWFPVNVGFQFNPRRWCVKTKGRDGNCRFALAVGPFRLEIARKNSWIL